MPLGTKVGFGPGNIVFDPDPAPTPSRAHPLPPIFGPSVVAKRWPISATAEHLLVLLLVFVIQIILVKVTEIVPLYFHF